MTQLSGIHTARICHITLIECTPKAVGKSGARKYRPLRECGDNSPQEINLISDRAGAPQ
jgi:hypothetical protein